MAEANVLHRPSGRRRRGRVACGVSEREEESMMQNGWISTQKRTLFAARSRSIDGGEMESKASIMDTKQFINWHRNVEMKTLGEPLMR